MRVPGRALCPGSGREPPLRGAPAAGAVDGGAGDHRLRPRRGAVGHRRELCARLQSLGGHRRDERGLPDPERLDPGAHRSAAGGGLAPRRRLPEGGREPGALRRRPAGPAGRRRGDHGQLPARGVRLPRSRRRPVRGQRRPARSGCGARVGGRARRRLRRRPRQRDGDGRVGRGGVGGGADDLPPDGGAFPPGGGPERRRAAAAPGRECRAGPRARRSWRTGCWRGWVSTGPAPANSSSCRPTGSWRPRWRCRWTCGATTSAPDSSRGSTATSCRLSRWTGWGPGRPQECRSWPGPTSTR